VDIFSLILLIFLCLLVTSLSYIDKKIYKFAFTPFVLLSVPITIIVFLLYLIQFKYNLVNINVKLLIIYIIFLAWFWLVGFLTFLIVKKGRMFSVIKNRNESKINLGLKQLDYIILTISFISSSLLLYFFFKNSVNYTEFGSVVQEDFQTRYSGGINFYFRMVCMFSTVYFLGTVNKKSKWRIFAAIYSMIPIFLSFVKGLILLPIIASFILNKMIKGNNFKFLNLIIGIAIGIGVFFGVYLFEYGVWDLSLIFDFNTYKKIFEKLIVYLISGNQSFNVNLTNNNSFIQPMLSNPVFAPFINFISKAGLVDRIDNIPSNWTFIGSFPEIGHSYVNTNGFIGTLWLYCGPLISFSMITIISIVFYLLFLRALISKSIINMLVYTILAATLALGWFEYYLLHPFLYYIWILLELLNFWVLITRRIVWEGSKKVKGFEI